jgi:transcriptional regulator with GAF, ATPase, and Fis domain
LKTAFNNRFKFSNIIGKSKPIQKILDLLEKVIQVRATVLIKGESVTGKELIAKNVYFNGIRKNHPFVPNREDLQNQLVR